MALIVENGVRRCNELGSIRRELTSVEVAIESRKVAAGNLKAQPVAAVEDVARGPKID